MSPNLAPLPIYLVVYRNKYDILHSPANTQRLAKSIAEAAQGHEIALN